MKRAFSRMSVLPSFSIVMRTAFHGNFLRQGSSGNNANHTASSSRNGSYVITLLGVAGLCLMRRNKENLVNSMAQFANYPSMFETSNEFIESCLAVQQYSTFIENRNPSNGKRRIFFRGETIEEAIETLRYGKSPIVTNHGSIVPPKIIDKTLHKKDNEKPGTCKGLTGLTTDLASTVKYEAVHLIIPTKTRIAPTSLHATDAEHNPQDQFVTAGLVKEDIFATLFRDSETNKISKIELNENFVGNLSELELDAQLRDVIALLPEGRDKQTLQCCINPELRYQDLYENKLAPCAESHAAGVRARQLFALSQESNEVRQTVYQLEHFFSYGVKEVSALQSNDEVDYAYIIRATDGRIFVPYGKQMGSNPGGFFMGNDGEPYYIKYAPANELVLTTDETGSGLSVMTDDPRRMNRTRFQNEYLMGQLYRAFGIEVPKTHLLYFRRDAVDYVCIASKFERNLVQCDTYQDGDVTRIGWRNNAHFLVALQRGGLVDFLLGDYDVIGLASDNMLGKKSKLTGQVEPIRIDPGAGLLFKAIGTPLDLTDTMSDFLTNELEPGDWWHGIFGQTFATFFPGLLSNYAILSSAIATLEKVSPERLEGVIRRYGYEDETLTNKVVDIVLKRREAILERVKKLQKKLYMKKIGDELAINQVEQAENHHVVKIVPSSFWLSPFPVGFGGRSSLLAQKPDNARRWISSSFRSVTLSDQVIINGARALGESIHRESVKRSCAAIVEHSFMAVKQLSKSLEEGGSDSKDPKHAEKWKEFGSVVEGDSNASSSDSDEEEESETSSNASTIAPSKRM